MLDDLSRAIAHLPESIPEAGDDDVLARFAIKPPVVANDIAWEVLDPMLNNVIGSDLSVEHVVGLIRRGTKGVEALWRYIRWFVVENGVPGVLLQGKMSVLMRAIEIR